MFSLTVFFLFTYLFASIPFGLFIGKVFYKKDIRLEGSKNIGATNVTRVCSKKAGFVTFLLDGLKGAIPVLISKTFFQEEVFYIVGLIAILGHIFPIYLNFKGGRGVATTLLILFAINFKLGSIAILIWIIFFILFGYSSLSSIAMSIFILPFSYIFSEENFYLFVFNFVFSTIILLKHRENIVRLLTKNEKKMFSKSIF